MREITDNQVPRYRPNTMKILSLDPGTDNYGFSAMQIHRKAFKLIRCGMLDDTIKEIKDAEPLKADAFEYVKRVDYLIRKSKATHVGAERYVPRRQGLSNESVNMMLGTVVTYAATLGIETSLFLAATWKLRLKKILDIEALYQECKPVPDHVVDAVFIGLFTAEKHGQFDLDSLKSKTSQKRLCKDIQNRFLDLRTHKRAQEKKERARASAQRRKRRSASATKRGRAR